MGAARIMTSFMLTHSNSSSFHYFWITGTDALELWYVLFDTLLIFFLSNYTTFYRISFRDSLFYTVIQYVLIKTTAVTTLICRYCSNFRVSLKITITIRNNIENDVLSKTRSVKLLIVPNFLKSCCTETVNCVVFKWSDKRSKNEFEKLWNMLQ